MKLASALKVINKKSKLKNSDYAVVLEILLNEISLDSLSKTSCEIKPYYEGYFDYSWRKKIHYKNGNVMSLDKYHKVYNTPIAAGYVDFCDTSAYAKEVKRLKEVSKKLKKDGFKVRVSWDKKYEKMGYNPYSPTLVVKW